MERKIFVKGNIFICRNFEYKDIRCFVEEKEAETATTVLSEDLYIDKNHKEDSPDSIYYATGEILPFCTLESQEQIFNSPELIYVKFQSEIKKLENLFNRGDKEEEAEQVLLRQLFIGMTDLLGAFLLELFEFLITNNKKYFQNYVRHSSHFKNQKIALSDIYDVANNLEKEVKKEIQEIGYHRLASIKKMYENAFEIQFPPIGELVKELLKRQTILHQSHLVKKDEKNNLTKNDLYQLENEVNSFMNSLAKELKLGIV